MVKRIFVEKKREFAVEAAGLFSDIRENLHLEGLRELRVINRYDVEGIDDDTLEMARYTVFAEPAIDTAWYDELEVPDGAFAFAAGYVPGQYDQRADSAEQCITLMDPSAKATVKFARVYILEGDLTEQDVQAVKDYVINPVDSREEGFAIPPTLDMDIVEPADVPVIEGFREMDEESLRAYRAEKEFAMSNEDLYHIHNYFKDEEQRDPTETELKVIDTYWSDHCRHTTFNTALDDIEFEDSAYGKVVKAAFDEYMAMREELYVGKNKNVCLMDMACIGAKYLKAHGKADNLDESEEINACSIKVKAEIDGKEEDWLVMFKNETHNHPTEIEPFGGAATCLGGAIRDPLSGRVYVYQAMRVTGAADPRVPVSETLEGKLPQRKITVQAAHGYSSYGNQIGLATGLVDEVYDEDYVAKRMEVGAVIGAAPADHVRREVPAPGDAVILVGGRTGRDGVGGATGSSKEHTLESIDECGAEVQKGNPPVERNLQRLFRRKEAAVMIKRCNDFGAGGVSVAIGELAEGLDIDLDLVPKKYEGLNGTELAVSESQERMAVVVEKENVETFIKYANEENLEATEVAAVTDTGRVRMSWRGKTILDLSRAFLDTNGATQRTDVTVAAEKKTAKNLLIDYPDPAEYLSDLNCCSKKGLIERFDSTIGAASVLMPLGGKYQLSPAMGMAAKLPVTEGETTTASLMAYGYDPKMAKSSPFHGALYSVLDSVTKIAALGGDISTIRLTFQEYFEKLTDRQSWGKPMAALLGGLKAQKELEIPAIGGKDSMSGTFM
ncbi:MAG: phosphoribosylformylglycinamidine synthase, partial [Firmicutes bacterium]|nr:phosphoribosylformylglycinamidine synthase [Bacillota bacterium]